MTLLPSFYNDPYPVLKTWTTTKGVFELFARPTWWKHNMKPIAPGAIETGFRYLMDKANPYFKMLFNYQRKKQAENRKYQINRYPEDPPFAFLYSYPIPHPEREGLRLKTLSELMRSPSIYEPLYVPFTSKVIHMYIEGKPITRANRYYFYCKDTGWKWNPREDIGLSDKTVRAFFAKMENNGWELVSGGEPGHLPIFVKKQPRIPRSDDYWEIPYEETELQRRERLKRERPEDYFSD